jgi:4-amino-4-deoxy-L-arabinose transferase-like glycosyltransferase
MIWRKHTATFILCLLLAAGYYLRSESLWQTVVVPPSIQADARDYFMYAYNLYYHGVYSINPRGLSEDTQTGDILPDAVRSPGYPLYIMLFMGSSPISVFLAEVLFSQVIISMLTIGLAFFLFRAQLGTRWAIAATLLVALSPHLIVVNSYLLTETLFCFFLLLAAWSFYAALKKPDWKRGALLGCTLAVSCLIRPSLQYFPIVAGLFLCATVGKRNGLRLAATMALGFFVTMSPWMVRNLVTLKKISDNSIAIGSLHHGMYPNFMYEGVKESYGHPYRFDPRASEISKDLSSVLGEIAARFRRAPLEHVVWYLIQKPIAFWSWNMVQGQGDVFIYSVKQTPYASHPVFQGSRQLMRWLHEPLVALCWLGCLLVWLPAVAGSIPRDTLASLRFFALLVLYFTSLHMLAAPFPRYSIPLRPFQYGMAMFTVSLFFAYLRTKIRHDAAPSLSLNG